MDHGAFSIGATAAGPRTLSVAVRRHPLVAGLARDLRGRCGFASGGAIVLGVSGGADSVALLLAMVVLRDRRPADAPRPMVAHVHHHLRGAAADADAQHVTTLCTDLDVPCRVEHARPAGRPGNVAANARAMRYAALEEVARSVGAGAVAVAHHADDQLETMLMALGRGAGLDGLEGMPWTRDLGDGVRLLRPFLGARHADCTDLCRTADAGWREDPTNDDRSGARARLRHDVLPVLETLWPGAAGRATGAADAIAAARAALEREIDSAFGPAPTRQWPRARLYRLAPATIAAGMRRAALDAAPEAGDALSQRVLLPVARAITDSSRRPRRFDWPGNLRIEVDAREVRLVPTESSP